MVKLSEKHRAIAALYEYLESRLDDHINRLCAVIDDGDGLEIVESLYHEFSDDFAFNQLLSAVKACGIEIYQYNENGFVYITDDE